MQYIIETHDDMTQLTRLFMSLDNSEVNIEYYLDRIRLAINNYVEYPEIIKMLVDLTMSKSSDADLTNKLMNHWNAVLLQLFYYILKVDMQLPIREFHLINMDLHIVTEG